MLEINRDAELTLTCSQCGHEFAETVGKIMDDEEITCPNCGTAFDTTEFSAQLEEALEETKASLNKAIEDFNRRQRGK